MTLPDVTLPDLQPTLVGPTVTIRPIANGDWTELFAAAADPAIWEVHPARDRYTEPEFRRFFDGALRSKMAFVVVDRDSGALIGSSRYHGYEPAFGEIEIGWSFLVRKHWGGETNREVKRLMLDHAFTFASTVVFWVGEQNFRSQRAMEKIGGQRRAGVFTRELTGADKPYLIYEITKGAYEGAGRALLG